LDCPQHHGIEINLDRPACERAAKPLPAEDAQRTCITYLTAYIYTFPDMKPFNLDHPGRQDHLKLDCPPRYDPLINLDCPLNTAAVSNDLPDINLECPVRSVSNPDHLERQSTLNLDRPGRQDPAVNLDRPVQPPVALKGQSNLNLDPPNMPP